MEVMSNNSIIVHTPASTANLGPGFDCLGLALDLWNKAVFTLEGQGIRVKVHGEGSGLMATDERNLVARAALRLYQSMGAPLPTGLTICCENHIPISSGLGSSAAGVLTGLMGANALLGKPASTDDLLRIATAMEGHPDNVAAALLGGLTLAITTNEGALASRLPVAPLKVAIAVPAIHLPTQAARAALPREVPLSDAVFNIGRTAFVIEALRSGDLSLLGKAMDDRLHQPYRLKMIPGGDDVFNAARQAGALAVALSGAGPSIIAYIAMENDAEVVAAAMVSAFARANIQARSLALQLSERGCFTETHQAACRTP
jgi:homoserine kinase